MNAAAKPALTPTPDGNTARRSAIVFVTTSALSLRFYWGLDDLLCKRGFEVVYVSSSGAELEDARNRGYETSAVEMGREISPARDFIALWKMYRYLRRRKPDVVVAGTPKAGLIGVVAARLAGVPRVVFLLHGLRSETLTGWKRQMVSSLEKLAAGGAHDVLCVSPSLRNRAAALGIVPLSKSSVVGDGSANGVDAAGFSSAAAAEAAFELREKLGLQGRTVIGFVGRVVADKGIAELVSAFCRLYERDRNLRLLLVGGYETGDPVPEAVRRTIDTHPGILLQEFTEPIHPWYRLFDILVLPTYREGLPTVLLEAQAAGVPIVTTRVTGTVDAVVEGETALVVDARDADALGIAMDRLLRDPALRTRMGTAGQSFVRTRFSRELVTKNMAEYYERLSEPCRKPDSVGELSEA